jgi:glycerate 2-kinase
MTPEVLLRQIFDKALAIVQPNICLPKHIPNPPLGRTIVVGAGKASAAMAKALENKWPWPLEGLVITRYGHKIENERINIVEASHPVPDYMGLKASQRILEYTKNLTSRDLVIVLISGGGSSLLTLPPDGISLEDKKIINIALLKSGAPISSINCVRKHISAIKGGRLARSVAPARLETLIISDVPGNDIATIASGPTVPDPTTFEEAISIIKKYNIHMPRNVLIHLEKGVDESPKPGDKCFANTSAKIIATPSLALDAAKDFAINAGYEVLLLGDMVEGEARVVASEHARQALATKRGTIILSGGELTVTLTGNGAGGPNTEYALALAQKLNGAPNIYALACDTDGIDGSEDNAGAIISPDTLKRAAALKLDPILYLKNNNSHEFFKKINGLIHTGPTYTNVNDFRAILVNK